MIHSFEYPGLTHFLIFFAGGFKANSLVDLYTDFEDVTDILG